MCPVYDFSCPRGHIVESRQGMDVETMPCSVCGEPAKRAPFYTDQYIFGETCAKNQRKVEVPLSERRYGKKLALFQEASQELDHTARKIENETGQPVKTPRYYKAAIQKAKRIKAGLEPALKR